MQNPGRLRAMLPFKRRVGFRLNAGSNPVGAAKFCFHFVFWSEALLFAGLFVLSVYVVAGVFVTKIFIKHSKMGEKDRKMRFLVKQVVKDENGNEPKILADLDALNWMDARGYEYIETLNPRPGFGVPANRYLFRRR